MQGVMEQYGLCFMMGVMWGESDNFLVHVWKGL
jgi:hypothetical protein